MDHVINASSLSRRASSSMIPDASAESSRRSYIFMASGEGGGDRGVTGVTLDAVELVRVRPNKEPDIVRRKFTIDVDFESAEGGVVSPLLLSLLRRAPGVRRGAVPRPSPVERGITVRKEGLGGSWKVSISSEGDSDRSTMVSWQRKPPSSFMTVSETGESIRSPLSAVSESSSVSDDE
jgi:hypothetical protein